MPKENSINGLFPSTDYSYVNNISKVIRNWSTSYGYNEIQLDDLIKVSDIKKVFDDFSNYNRDYVIVDNKKEKFILRPDANIAFMEKMSDLGRNIIEGVNYKFFYIDKFYSFENSDKSKADDFPLSFGFYAVGQNNYIADAEVIKMSYYLLKELGFDVNVRVNIVGCSECFKRYKSLLTNYLKTKKSVLCNDCVKNLAKNPLAVLRCENKNCKKIISQAPIVVDNLCEVCNEYSMNVVEYLDELEVSYTLDPTLIDYKGVYGGFYFEFEIIKNNSAFSIGKGGHLDDYANLLGFKKGVTGVSFNLNYIIKRLREVNKDIEFYNPKVYLAQIGETARKKALQSFIKLREAGIDSFCNILEKSVVKQVAQAKAMEAKFVLILGQQEVVDNTIIIRDIETNVQEVINYNHLIDEIKKRMLAKLK